MFESAGTATTAAGLLLSGGGGGNGLKTAACDEAKGKYSRVKFGIKQFDMVRTLYAHTSTHLSPAHPVFSPLVFDDFLIEIAITISGRI